MMTPIRVGLLLLMVLSSCKREAPPAGVAAPKVEPVKDAGLSAPSPSPSPAARRQEALKKMPPANVEMSIDDAGTIDGRAKSFDDVSEFMRHLNNMVWTPSGLGRVVERQRGGNFRVELVGSDLIAEVTQVDFVFANLELKSTEVIDGGVHFTLQFDATE